MRVPIDLKAVSFYLTGTLVGTFTTVTALTFGRPILATVLLLSVGIVFAVLDWKWKE